MARINAKGTLKGAVGAVYYRTFNGQLVVQSKPGKGTVKQASSTKSAATDFGCASQASKCIRRALYPILQGRTDAGMYRRFTSRVIQAVNANEQLPKGSRQLAQGDLQLLVGFDFNQNSPLEAYTAIRPNVMVQGSGLQLTLPAFAVATNLSAPFEASHAEYVILVTVFDAGDWQETAAQMFRVAFALHDAAVPQQIWQMEALPANSVAMVTAGVLYFRQNNLAGSVLLNNKHLHPVGLVAAVLL